MAARATVPGRYALLLVVLALATGCQVLGPVTGEVQVGEGRTRDGEAWRAVLTSRDGETTCLQIRFELRATADLGCTWRSPIRGLRVGGDGVVVATADAGEAQRARMRTGDGAVMEAPVVAGAPLSDAAFVVLLPPVAPRDLPALAFDLELLDASGQVVGLLAR